MPSRAGAIKSVENKVFQAFYPGTSQTKAVGATSASATVFGANTSVVRLCATTDCFIKVEASHATAASTDMFLPGTLIPEYICVDPGTQLAVIQSTASGTLYITEGA
jgi:hypothetical protein